MSSQIIQSININFMTTSKVVQKKEQDQIEEQDQTLSEEIEVEVELVEEEPTQLEKPILNREDDPISLTKPSSRSNLSQQVQETMTPPTPTENPITKKEEPEPQLPELFEEDPNYIFGTVNIILSSITITENPQFIKWTLDISGSMDDLCADGRSKMKHAILTTKNMLKIASESKAEIWVQVDAFDDKIESIIPAQRITKENLFEMVSKVEQMMPRNGTNIELALKDAEIQMSTFYEYQQQNSPDKYFDITQIFLTDGQANKGISNTEMLKALVNEKYNNIFIGFGLDHSSVILDALSSKRNGSYYFIDKIENGGLVFGSIMNNLLYRILSDITIEIINGEIYNAKTNEWNTTLIIDNWVSQDENTYHLRSNQEYDISVKITATKNDGEQIVVEEDLLPKLIYPTEEEQQEVDKQHNSNIIPYIFRQRVLELLFQAKQATPTLLKYQELKRIMRTFLEDMNKYMEKHNLQEDPRFQLLNDDMVIATRTIGSQYQHMFSTIRHIGNARQYSYTVNELPIDLNEEKYAKIQSYKNSYFGLGLQRQTAFGQLQRQTNYQYNEDDDDKQQVQDQDQDQDQNQGQTKVKPILGRMMSGTPINRTNMNSTKLALMRSTSEGSATATQILYDFTQEEEEEN